MSMIYEKKKYLDKYFYSLLYLILIY